MAVWNRSTRNSGTVNYSPGIHCAFIQYGRFQKARYRFPQVDQWSIDNIGPYQDFWYFIDPASTIKKRSDNTSLRHLARISFFRTVKGNRPRLKLALLVTGVSVLRYTRLEFDLYSATLS